MIGKKGLLALVVAVPFAASLAQADIHDIDSLRAKCNEVASNAQMKKFDMKILCAGNYSRWEEVGGAYALPNKSQMFAQTSTKCNRFQTAEVSFAAELPRHQGTCGVYAKKVMRVPDGVGIPVAITDCNQLTHEYVEAVCQERLHQYCGDQFVVGSSSSSSSSSTHQGEGHAASSSSDDATCVLDTVETVDTCSMY